MPEELELPPVTSPRRSARFVLLIALLGFIIGGGAVGWLAHTGALWSIPDNSSPATVNGPQPITLPPDARVAALEARLTRIEQQSAASEGNTAHAEALLVAFAARRALERGAPLGLLEGQLQQRFGANHGDAVAAIITAARYPVTLGSLSTQLDALAPQFRSNTENTSDWSHLKQQLSNLFVLRRERHDTPDPASLLAQVRANLDAGNLGKAMAAMEAMPKAERASAWIAAVRRLDAGQKALDVIENAALQ